MQRGQEKRIKIFTKNDKEQKAPDSINKLKVEIIRKVLNQEITDNDLRILLKLCYILENGKEEQTKDLRKKLPRKFYSALKEGLPLVNDAFKLIETLIRSRLGDD